MLDYRVLRRIFGTVSDELTMERRELHNEELNDLYCTSNIVQVIKSKRMGWAGHVARMGRGEAYAGVLWGNLKERDHLGDSGVDGRIILKRYFRNWNVVVCT